MRASFVILNYNRRAEVLETIDKTKLIINGELSAYEIIVVDNASTDGSAAAIKEAYPDIVLIERKDNTGVAGWNYGFEIAKGNFFIVLDDDSNLVSGLNESLTYMEQNPDVGVLALNVTTGPYTSEIYKWGDKEDVAGFIGCGAIISKALYNKIGGFAEWLFVYAHEWEYGIRSINAGYKVRYFAGSNVIHRASSINRTSKRLKVFCTRNEMAIVYKYFKSHKSRYLIRMFLNGLKSLKSEGIKPAYYTILGAYKFLKMRKNLLPAPVSESTQNFYAVNFWSTQPVFYYIKKRFNRLRGNKE